MEDDNVTSESSEADAYERIHVRVSPELKQQVRVEAAKAGQSISEYVREGLRADVEGDTTDDE
jgi:predicted HicB family RNase H-like nuclease